MKPEDEIRVALARKTAKSIVDHGSIPMATLKESIILQEKVDELLAKEIEFPEQEPFPEIPEYPTEISVLNLPEVQTVEVINFPEQKAPIVKIEASNPPVVNVEAPIINLDNEEVVSELKNILEALSKEKVEGVEKSQIVDEKGEIVDFKKLFENLSTKVGNIRGGGSSLAKNLLNQLGTVINPATEEKQDAIITAIAGIGGAVKYDSRFEDGATYMYVGEALPGSSDSSSVWRIKRYVQSTLAGNWADGTDAFTKSWDDRATYTY